jgi:hypothetical protein
MIKREKIIYISFFIFVSSLIYSVLDLYTTDKQFTTSDYYISIFFFFLYKFLPALIIGNIKVEYSYYIKPILIWLNYAIAILFLPTFYVVYINKNPHDISYFIHSCRELFNFFCIIVILMNLLLKNNTLITIINILLGLIIFKSKIFLVTIFLFYILIYIKNKYRAILLLIILLTVFSIYYYNRISSGSGRDSEINHIAYAAYSIDNYGTYNKDLIGNIVIHSVVPNLFYRYIYNKDKDFIDLDRLFSDYYGYPIEDYNANPVIPFLFAYGHIGFIIFIALYNLYIIILTVWAKRADNKLFSFFLLSTLIVLIFKIELDLIIVFQFIKWQIIFLIMLMVYKKCY